ncbi:MAG: cystathionine gamma-lyase [Hyphomonas sp.]
MVDPLSPISRLLHHRSERLSKGDPVALPIVASSTFLLPGDPDGSHFYGRNGNPTVEQVEEEIGILEGGNAVLFPSGMAAIASVFYAYLRPGDAVLVHADGYYNVRALLETQFAALGVHIRTCPTAEMMSADKTGCRLVMIETPSNPGLSVCDIAGVAARAKAAGALLVVDNTTPTAICQQPLDLGADLVVMSDTKAMAGHSDVLAGHVAARDNALLEPVRTWRRLAGAIVSPFDAYLLHRGIATLELRLTRACANAMAAAEVLRGHPAVGSVHYPGLTNDPSHAIASKQMSAFGPVVSFTLTNRRTAEKFIENNPLVTAATSFGGVHTSAECRIRWGDDVPEGFVRLACGIEPTHDLVASLTRTLDSVA